MTWILILLTMGGYGPTSQAIVFHSEASCQEAAAVARQDQGWDKANCVRDGEIPVIPDPRCANKTSAQCEQLRRGY